MADGKARQFSLTMEAKSVITFPSGETKLPGAGFYNITGLAWSGRGRIQSVDVSTDGGKTWHPARIDSTPEPMCTVRFSFPWMWDGKAAVLQSRCTDETGYIQPTIRGTHRHPWIARKIRVDLSPQCDPELGHRERRECEQCPCISFASW